MPQYNCSRVFTLLTHSDVVWEEAKEKQEKPQRQLNAYGDTSEYISTVSLVRAFSAATQNALSLLSSPHVIHYSRGAYWEYVQVTRSMSGRGRIKSKENSKSSQLPPAAS